MAWPLSDNFNRTAGENIQVGNSTWVQHQYNNSASVITADGRVRCAAANNSLYYCNDAPSSADYAVEADLYAASQVNSAGIAARLASAANTFYYLRFAAGSGWTLYKFVNGTATQLGSTITSKNIVTGSAMHCKLSCVGSTIAAFIDGAATADISVTDTAISDAGYAGIRLLTVGTPSDSTSIQLDNFAATVSGGGGTTTSSADALSATITVANSTDIINYRSSADSLSYTLTPTSATSTKSFTSTTDPLSFSVSVQAATSIKNTVSIADIVATALTLYSATSTYTPVGTTTSVADPLTLALSSVSATSIHNRLSSASPDSVTLTVADATSGVYTLQHITSAAETVTYLITCYDLTGTSRVWIQTFFKQTLADKKSKYNSRKSNKYRYISESRNR